MEEYCPALAEMLRSKRAVGESGKVFDGIGAVSTVNNLAVIRSLMLGRKPERTLEVGLSFGGSALVFAASHRDLGRPAARQHLAFDPYQQSIWDNAGLANLTRAGLDGFVEARSQPSATGLAALVESGEKFDLIYIDGSHIFDDVFVDAYFSLRLLSDEGLVLFDDCTIDHVSKVFSFIRANYRTWTAEVDLSEHHPSGTSARYQVGKRLGQVQLRAVRRTGADTRAWDVPLRGF